MILSNFEKLRQLRHWTGNVQPEYLLLHTISHLIIRSLAERSGYSESSIKERIYCEENNHAILIYTASNSSEGSLGGLVKNSAKDDLLNIFMGVARKSGTCSRDPLCIESDLEEGPIHTRLNGAACYACSLLPEPSCENFNRMLDRKLLSDEKYGFFSGLDE